MLIQLCYASVEATPFDEPALERLLKQAREANALQGLTGILLYAKGRFVQLLEGESSAVEAVFAKIAGDPRHQQVFEVYRQSVSTRDFPNWTMAFKRLSEVKPEFLLDRSKARALIANLLEQMR